MTFVQNFTDIDDKILKRADEENSTMTAVSERNIESFHQDMDSLGILRPDRMPRATQCLDGIRDPSNWKPKVRPTALKGMCISQ